MTNNGHTNDLPSDVKMDVLIEAIKQLNEQYESIQEQLAEVKEVAVEILEKVSDINIAGDGYEIEN